jgi:hypothetical protein
VSKTARLIYATLGATWHSDRLAHDLPWRDDWRTRYNSRHNTLDCQGVINETSEDEYKRRMPVWLLQPLLRPTALFAQLPAQEATVRDRGDGKPVQRVRALPPA